MEAAAYRRAIMKRFALVCLLFAAGPVFAADAGWGVQFHYDAFEDKTYPMAAMREATEGITMDAANLFLVCNDGGVAAIFQPERYSFYAGGVSGKFRGATGIEEFQFNPIEVPAFGNVRAVTGSEARALLAIFDTATSPVPFQSGSKSGNFPVAGFKDVDAIMAEKCAAL